MPKSNPIFDTLSPVLHNEIYETMLDEVRDMSHEDLVAAVIAGLTKPELNEYVKAAKESLNDCGIDY